MEKICQLRPIGPGDAEICVRLFIEVFANPPWDYHWVTPEKTGRYLGDLLRAPGACSFLYYENDVPVGFCVGSVNDYFFAPQYEIKEFAVVATHQQKGIGTRLLSAIEAELKKRQVTYVFLQTSKTIPAFDFYLKNGYRTVEENAYFIKDISH